MPQLDKPRLCRFICTGDEMFPAMLAAINAAQRTIRLEMYIFAGDELGTKFLTALVEARKRGVDVRVMIDSGGSLTLSGSFWEPLVKAGGDVRWFNPIALKRFNFRDHRKILVCDEEVAFTGGYNISKDYDGDGIKSGWHDLGIEVHGEMAEPLADAFDEMFPLAEFKHKRFMRLRRTRARRQVSGEDCQLLLSGPGRGANPFLKSLLRDISHAKNVQIVVAYFLPSGRLRRALARVVKRGGRVQLILAAKSDVPISQQAALSFYRRLFNAGIEIYEFQPQILHAKLMIVDGNVYVGSSNLDVRSLRINYELMLRYHDGSMAKEAANCFARSLAHSKKVEFEEWKKTRTWWRRIRARWACFILARVDPYVARWQYKRLPP